MLLEVSLCKKLQCHFMLRFVENVVDFKLQCNCDIGFVALFVDLILVCRKCAKKWNCYFNCFVLAMPDLLGDWVLFLIFLFSFFFFFFNGWLL